jgi:hypothetical protein
VVWKYWSKLPFKDGSEAVLETSSAAPGSAGQRGNFAADSYLLNK